VAHNNIVTEETTSQALISTQVKMKKQGADLLQGTFELLILRLLRSGRLNGWDIMQRIELITGEVLTVSPGSPYPALHRLERRKIIAAEWGESVNNRPAKFYDLTVAGRKQLSLQQKRWKRSTGAVEAILRKA